MRFSSWLLTSENEGLPRDGFGIGKAELCGDRLAFLGLNDPVDRESFAHPDRSIMDISEVDAGIVGGSACFVRRVSGRPGG